MEESVTIRDGNFFRPRKKREEKGVEKFHGVLKKAILIVFRLLLLTLFFFIGHWVYAHLLDAPFFRLRGIEVEGNRKIPQETVLSLTKLEGMPNLFMLRLKDVAERLESHPWIEEVKVKKLFPNKIWIQIKERKPIAILQLEELYYIDTKGVIFSPVGDEDQYNYPFLTGLTRQKLGNDPIEAKHLIMKALELLKTVDQEKFFPLEEISEIHMEKVYGIQYVTKTEDVEVKMGWEDYGEKLRRLSIVWSDLQKKRLSVVSIDCRDIKRIVVRMSPDGENSKFEAPAYRAGRQNSKQS